MSHTLEAAEADPVFFMELVEGMAALDRDFRVRLLERLGIPVISRATSEALKDVGRRNRGVVPRGREPGGGREALGYRELFWVGSNPRQRLEASRWTSRKIMRDAAGQRWTLQRNQTLIRAANPRLRKTRRAAYPDSNRPSPRQGT
jgi:hypothetical protein